MSQSTVPQAAQPLEIASFDESRTVNEFNYRPVPILAPVSLFLGVASAFALFSIFLVVVPLIALPVAATAWLKVRRSEGAYGGAWLAKSGLGLAVVFLVAGVAKDRYLYAIELPEGHVRVHFNRDISKKGFVFDEDGQRALHPDVAALDGEKIFVKGYMWNTGSMTGLSDFLLLKDNGKCCFGGNPKATDMMLVKMQDGRTADARTGMVAVAGTLESHPEAGMQPAGDAEMPVYILKATQVGPARTPH